MVSKAAMQVSSRNFCGKYVKPHARAPASGTVFSQAPQVVQKHKEVGEPRLHREERGWVRGVSKHRLHQTKFKRQRALFKALAIRERGLN